MERGRRLFSTVFFSYLLVSVSWTFPEFEMECHAISNAHSGDEEL